MSRTSSVVIVPGRYTGPVTPMASPLSTPPEVYDFYSKVAQGQRSPLGTTPPASVGGSGFFTDAWYAEFYRKNKVTLEQALAKQKEVRRSRLANVWAGLAVEGGGHFVLAGKKSYGGRLWNLADNDRWCNFKCEVKTFGLGLGGGGAVGMIFFFNVPSLYKAEGLEHGNGGELSFSIPSSQVKKLAEALKSVHSLIESWNLFKEVREIAESIDKVITTNEPVVVYKALAGAKVEIGWKYGIQGKIDILGVQGKHGYLDDL